MTRIIHVTSFSIPEDVITKKDWVQRTEEISVSVFNTFPCHFTEFMDNYGHLFTCVDYKGCYRHLLNVSCQSIFRNIFSEKNGDVFNTHTHYQSKGWEHPNFSTFFCWRLCCLISNCTLKWKQLRKKSCNHLETNHWLKVATFSSYNSSTHLWDSSNMEIKYYLESSSKFCSVEVPIKVWQL